MQTGLFLNVSTALRSADLEMLAAQEYDEDPEEISRTEKHETAPTDKATSVIRGEPT